MIISGKLDHTLYAGDTWSQLNQYSYMSHLHCNILQEIKDILNRCYKNRYIQIPCIHLIYSNDSFFPRNAKHFQCILMQGTLNVAPHISVAHGLIYTLSNCMHHERAKRSECVHAVRQVTRIPLTDCDTSWPKAWCMVLCTTPVSQSECRDLRSKNTKGE